MRFMPTNSWPRRPPWADPDGTDPAMLKADTRDPAALPRLLLTLLALALLWPGLRLSELNPGVLLQAENRQQMGSFVSAFWPPAHDSDFLSLLFEATLQTLAVATAGMALALLLAVPTSLLASRALSLRAASRGGRPGLWSRLLRMPVRGLLVFCAACRRSSGLCCSCAPLALGLRLACWRLPSPTPACSVRSTRKSSNRSTSARPMRCCRPEAGG